MQSLRLIKLVDLLLLCDEPTPEIRNIVNLWPGFYTLKYKKPQPVIEMKNQMVTDRLCLDLLTEADHQFILALVNSQGWLDFIGDRNVHSTEEAIAYIHKVMNTQDLFYWVVRVTRWNIPVGIISFIKRSYLDNFDIGFAFLPEYNGNGYACEAAKAVLSMVSRHPGYYPVLATTLPQNIRSVRLLTKLGFHFEKQMEVEGERLLVYSNAVAALQDNKAIKT
jgi:[ribosomal protein S5]-alanine N-acetyltransferase